LPILQVVYHHIVTGQASHTHEFAFSPKGLPKRCCAHKRCWQVFGSRAALITALVAFLPGCVPIPAGFDSPVPGARIDASVRAANERDAEAIPDLIALLDSEDPATRLIADNALEWILGRETGFDHAGTWAERRAEVERLRQAYLAGELVPQAEPTPVNTGHDPVDQSEGGITPDHEHGAAKSAGGDANG
jgi:hypothetical protein